MIRVIFLDDSQIANLLHAMDVAIKASTNARAASEAMTPLYDAIELAEDATLYDRKETKHEPKEPKQ